MQSNRHSVISNTDFMARSKISTFARSFARISQEHADPQGTCARHTETAKQRTTDTQTTLKSTAAHRRQAGPDSPVAVRQQTTNSHNSDSRHRRHMGRRQRQQHYLRELAVATLMRVAHHLVLGRTQHHIDFPDRIFRTRERGSLGLHSDYIAVAADLVHVHVHVLLMSRGRRHCRDFSLPGDTSQLSDLAKREIVITYHCANFLHDCSFGMLDRGAGPD